MGDSPGMQLPSAGLKTIDAPETLVKVTGSCVLPFPRWNDTGNIVAGRLTLTKEERTRKMLTLRNSSISRDKFVCPPVDHLNAQNCFFTFD